jgi:hypothetical protein
MVGEDELLVGLMVGLMVGDRVDGTRVGKFDGCNVGRNVGPFDGLTVGGVVGDAVVGEFDGLAVDFRLGESVGDRVDGDRVESVGILVGEVGNTLEGVIVGTPLGIDVEGSSVVGFEVVGIRLGRNVVGRFVGPCVGGRIGS